MLYNAYLIYKYYNYLYYLFIVYHGVKISYDSYYILKYVSSFCITENNENIDIMLYEIEQKNDWNYLEIYK
jgi:hypothetical protein